MLFVFLKPSHIISVPSCAEQKASWIVSFFLSLWVKVNEIVICIVISVDANGCLLSLLTLPVCLCLSHQVALWVVGLHHLRLSPVIVLMHAQGLVVFLYYLAQTCFVFTYFSEGHGVVQLSFVLLVLLFLVLSLSF